METHSNSFVIAIKIKHKISKISVNLHENRHSLYNKWKTTYPDCTLSETEFIQKLSAKLQALSESDRVAECMRQSIRLFVQKIKEEWKDQSLQCQLSEIPAYSGIKSCFSEVQIIAQRQAMDQEIQTEDQLFLGKNILKESFAVNIEPKSKAQVKTNSHPIRQLNNKRSATQNKGGFSKVSDDRKRNYPRKKKCNPDIIKACEAIIKKCAQNDMKSMARDFMKEKGYLQEQKTAANKERRTVFITQQSDYTVQAEKQRHSFSLVNEKESTSFWKQGNVPSVKKEIGHGTLIVKNRFKYLQFSNLSLAKDYDERQKTTEMQEVRPQKKYNYLDF